MTSRFYITDNYYIMYYLIYKLLHCQMNEDYLRFQQLVSRVLQR